MRFDGDDRAERELTKHIRRVLGKLFLCCCCNKLWMTHKNNRSSEDIPPRNEDEANR